MMEKEMLSEKESQWLEKRSKAQKFFLILAVFCFICAAFYLFLYLTSDYKVANLAGYYFTMALIVGCFLMGIRSEANKFLKIIDKLK